MSTIYEQLGGEPAMQELAETFYRKMLSDDRVSHFFDDVDMDKQIAKQQAFLTIVAGGPNNYTGRDMRTSHAHLLEKGLNDTHVDVVIHYLGETLAEMGASAEIINTVKTV
ncbi:MAG: group 1 truncated hemoglobin, partial [Candidatus Sumerlaeia bacterium]|nr:group 1 truncated hemoglobin [Candidatus Sumerlaeia bacterium]